MSCHMNSQSIHTVLNIIQVFGESLINVISHRWTLQYHYWAALVFLESCGITSSAMWPVERAGRRTAPSASLHLGCSVNSTTKECWTSGWSSGWVTRMLIGWLCILSQICMTFFCFIYKFEKEFKWFSFLDIYLYLDNIGCCIRQGIKKLNLYESMIFTGWFSSELCWTIF